MNSVAAVCCNFMSILVLLYRAKQDVPYPSLFTTLVVHQGVIIGWCVGWVLTMWISLGSLLAGVSTPPLNTSIAECNWNTTTALNVTLMDESAPAVL